MVMRRVSVVVTTASLLGVVVASALAAQGDTTLVSRQSAATGGGSTDGGSSRPSISGNGRVVAFDSVADNLSDDDAAALGDVFVRDIKDQATTLVSRRSGPDGAGATDISEESVLSANGRFVVFESEADNLSGAANDAFDNVFVRDLERDRSMLVSRRCAAAGGAGATAISRSPVISANGRFVAFRSDAANLSGADVHDPMTGDVYSDVFVRDLKERRTILVSRRSAAAGGGAGNEESFGPSISADGRYVAFASRAENLSAVDVTSQDIFVHDRKRHRTLLASRRSAAAGGEAADNDSNTPAISADGRFVAFISEAANLSGADEAVTDIFVRDLRRKRTELASRQSTSAGGAGADDDSISPAISGDGRFVSFNSGADNLTGDDDDDFTNVYARDLENDLINLVSVTGGGDAADGDSFAASMSRKGRFVAFSSDAANLSDDDANDIVLGDLHTDVFRHDLLGP
jgi:Tol biopolymer transport system component